MADLLQVFYMSYFLVSPNGLRFGPCPGRLRKKAQVLDPEPKTL